MILWLISTSIIIIFLIIILIDIIPLFSAWSSRIHIGRYSDKEAWGKSIAEIASKWLIKTPKIKVTDNLRLIFIDMLKGNYTKDTIQHWQEAALILGVKEHIKNYNHTAMKNNLNKYLIDKFDNEGQWIKKPQNIDCAILSYAILNLENINIEKYKPAFEYTCDLIKEHIGDDGTVYYRKAIKQVRFVDTIGFICPFLTAYGLRFNKNECIDLAFNQIQQYEKYGMLDKYCIPCHAYDIETSMPLGIYGWGRGLGWYAIGLIDTYNQLPQESKYKSELKKSVENFALSIILFQNNDGSWTWNVADKGSRNDSSTTVLLGWFLLNASEIKEISEKCFNAAKKAIEYIMKVTRRDGTIDFSQGDTKGIGVYSQVFGILPFTQGLALRLINLYLNKLGN